MFAIAQKAPTAKIGRIPAPRGGWVQNVAMLEPPPYTAEVLDNFFPTGAGARMRRGQDRHATTIGATTALMAYQGASNKLFGADASNVFEITTPADPLVAPTADLTSLSGGDWSWINFATSGGRYLWMCNGADAARHYNGTTWATPAITVATSSTFSHVWAFSSRIFAVQGGTLDAWYLPVDAIAGAATLFPLKSVFTQGGSLLFGAAWSLDSGAGIDDVCIFVSDQGEIAVYEGSDPSTDFALAGVYQVSKPLSKHAFFKAGGDIAICTEDGIISVAAAVQGDRSAISRSAITYPIEDAWRDAVTLRTASHTFNSTIWHSQQMLFVSVPNDYQGINQVFVANTRTGAWCRFTGWDVQCSVVMDDQYYYGDSTGAIFKGEQQGQDEDAAYTTRWLPKFTPMGLVVALNMARVIYRGNVTFAPEVAGAVDFDTTAPASPVTATDESESAWGTGIWGGMIWGLGGIKTASTEWMAIGGVGNEVSIWLQSTSGRTTAPNIELIGMEYLFETARPL